MYDEIITNGLPFIILNYIIYMLLLITDKTHIINTVIKFQLLHNDISHIIYVTYKTHIWKEV